MAEDKNTKARKPKIEESKLPNLSARLEAVKCEYKYLQDARTALHTRTGILIALLSALVSVAFIRDSVGIIELFKTNLILAHFRIILLVALFVSFFIALISYVRIFFTHDYLLFPYAKYTCDSDIEALQLSNETVIIAMYKDYASCIENNQKIFETIVKHYRLGNKWLIATIVFTVCTLITTLI